MLVPYIFRQGFQDKLCRILDTHLVPEQKQFVSDIINCALGKLLNIDCKNIYSKLNELWKLRGISESTIKFLSILSANELNLKKLPEKLLINPLSTKSIVALNNVVWNCFIEADVTLEKVNEIVDYHNTNRTLKLKNNIEEFCKIRLDDKTDYLLGVKNIVEKQLNNEQKLIHNACKIQKNTIFSLKKLSTSCLETLSFGFQITDLLKNISNSINRDFGTKFWNKITTFGPFEDINLNIELLLSNRNEFSILNEFLKRSGINEGLKHTSDVDSNDNTSIIESEVPISASVISKPNSLLVTTTIISETNDKLVFTDDNNYNLQNSAIADNITEQNIQYLQYPVNSNESEEQINMEDKLIKAFSSISLEMRPKNKTRFIKNILNSEYNSEIYKKSTGLSKECDHKDFSKNTCEEPYFEQKQNINNWLKNTSLGPIWYCDII